MPLLRTPSLPTVTTSTVPLHSTEKIALCSSILSRSPSLPFPLDSTSPSHLAVPSPSSLPGKANKRPRSDAQIQDNPLRPAVLAADRLFTWRTPHGLDTDSSLDAELAPELRDAVHMSVRSYYAPNTKGTYGAGILRFTQFCDKWSIPEAHRMPASWSLLCAFISAHRGKQAGNTIKTWMAGIRAWHIVNRAHWYGDDEWVSMCRTAAKRDGTRFKRPLRAPVSIEHLLILRRALQPSNSFHAAVWAVALTSFFGCRRLGETTVSSAQAFDPKYHAPASSTVIFSTLRDGTRSASFHIPWTKTTREDGADIILTARSDEILCPVKALFIHRQIINKECPADMSLFAYQSPSGSWTHMVKSTFLSFCDSIWKAAGLEHVLGHSFRIGGAVELLLAGVNSDVVAATGGWTSLAFLLYWRRMEEIIPLSTSRAYKRSHIEGLTSIFEEFRIRHNIPRSFLSDVHTLD